MTAHALINDPVTYAAWLDDTQAAVMLEGETKFLVGDRLIQGEALFPDVPLIDKANALKMALRTSQERILMSAQYTRPERLHWQSQGLSYSILREARRVSEDRTEIADLLHECVVRAYTVMDVQRVVREIREQAPAPTVIIGTLSFKRENGRWIVAGGDLAGVEEGVLYQVRLTR